MNYGWPGNIRELFNTVEMLVNITDQDEIGLQDLPLPLLRKLTAHSEESSSSAKVSNQVHTDPHISLMDLAYRYFTKGQNDFLSKPNLKKYTTEQEKELILRILKEVNGNKTRAARELGIHRSTLYVKLKRYNLRCN